MIRSPKISHDFFAGCKFAGSRAGRDFIGTTSTSASVRSLWTTFTFSKESSTCTGVSILSDDNGAARKMEAGFNLLTHVVARAVAPWAANTGIFGIFIVCGIVGFFVEATESCAVGFCNSGCADGFVNGVFGETNCGR